MYARSAAYYDAIYGAKDYRGEAERVRALVEAHRRTDDRGLLDVACGTGGHLPFLRHHFAVEGLDIEPGMLAVARERLPDAPFHQADMVAFDLGRRFGAVVCLFSAIGYARTIDRLRQAVATFARHALPGGVVLVEPWFTPEAWRVGHVAATFVDRPDLKLARLSVSQAEGNLAVMDMHHLVATPEGIEHFVERHEMGLFTDEEYRQAFEAAGLAVTHDPEGLIGRGLYVGVRA